MADALFRLFRSLISRTAITPVALPAAFASKVRSGLRPDQGSIGPLQLDLAGGVDGGFECICGE